MIKTVAEPSVDQKTTAPKKASSTKASGSKASGSKALELPLDIIPKTTAVVVMEEDASKDIQQPYEIERCDAMEVVSPPKWASFTEVLWLRLAQQGLTHLFLKFQKGADGVEVHLFCSATFTSMPHVLHHCVHEIWLRQPWC